LGSMAIGGMTHKVDLLGGRGARENAPQRATPSPVIFPPP
jgi:hypothetical protein